MLETALVESAYRKDQTPELAKIGKQPRRPPGGAEPQPLPDAPGPATFDAATSTLSVPALPAHATSLRAFRKPLGGTAAGWQGRSLRRPCLVLWRSVWQGRRRLRPWHPLERVFQAAFVHNQLATPFRSGTMRYNSSSTIVRFAQAIVAFFALTLVVVAQESVPVAAHEKITIAAWNLEWYFDADKSDNESQTAKEQSAPSDAEYKWRVKEIAGAIANFKPTILALEEIENKKVLNDLAERLKTHHQLEYDVGFIQGKDTFTEQDVGFLVRHRPGTQTYARVEQSGLSFNNPNLFKIPTKHLALTVVHATPTETQKLTVIVLHLKAGGQLSDEEQRKRQARVLHRWAKKLMSEGHAVIILGDTNVQTAPANASSSNAIGILRGLHTNTHKDDLADLHEDLPSDGQATHVAGKALDRILLSPQLLDDAGLVFKNITIRRDVAIRGTVDNVPMFSVPQAQRDLSDHFPLVATFEYVPQE